MTLQVSIPLATLQHLPIPVANPLVNHRQPNRLLADLLAKPLGHLLLQRQPNAEVNLAVNQLGPHQGRDRRWVLNRHLLDRLVDQRLVTLQLADLRHLLQKIVLYITFGALRCD